jgi:hypothetical protein
MPVAVPAENPAEPAPTTQMSALISLIGKYRAGDE